MNRSINQPSNSSSSSVNRRSISYRSPHKTVSKRAQRRVHQLVDNEEAVDADHVHGKHWRGRRVYRRREKQQFEQLMEDERQRRDDDNKKETKMEQLKQIDGDNDTKENEGSNSDINGDDDNDDDKEAKEDRAMAKQRSRLYTLVNSYHIKFATINDRLVNPPESSAGIHPYHGHTLRKARGAERYHDKMTLMGKSRKRHTCRDLPSSNRAWIMSLNVKKIADDAKRVMNGVEEIGWSQWPPPKATQRSKLQHVDALVTQLESPNKIVHKMMTDMYQTWSGRAVHSRRRYSARPHVCSLHLPFLFFLSRTLSLSLSLSLSTCTTDPNSVFVCGLI
jgi:hypothetical protein